MTTASLGHVALHRTEAPVTMALAARHTQKRPDELVVVARVLASPTARRRGVGHALLDAAVAEARRRGLHPVLDVATGLRPAVTLYESAGWVRAGDVTIHLDKRAQSRLLCLHCAPVDIAPTGADRRGPTVTKP